MKKADRSKPLPVELVLDEDDLFAIGCLTVEVTRLESCLDSLISDLCGFDDTRRGVFTDKWMISSKTEALFGLLEPYAKSARRKSQLRELKTRISTLIQDRNTVTHGRWREDLFSGVKTAVRKKQVVRSERVIDLAYEAVDCIRELLKTYKQIAPARRRASPTKPPQPRRPP